MAVKPPVAGEARRPGRPAKSSLDAAALIRAAALDVFARSGFNGASVAEIARQAAVRRMKIPSQGHGGASAGRAQAGRAQAGPLPDAAGSAAVCPRRA